MIYLWKGGSSILINTGKQLIERWRTNFDFKTITAASGSLAVTTLFALYNGFLGIYHSTVWYGAICAYYIVLVALRGIIITARKGAAVKENPERARTKAYITAAALLLILNLSLIVPVSLMVRLQKPVEMSLIPAIAMAAYTTYKITMASINLKRRKRSSDSLVRLLRTIGFIDALVSILTLQNTLIMVNSSGSGAEMRPLTEISSAVIMLVILGLSVVAILKGVDSMRTGD